MKCLKGCEKNAGQACLEAFVVVDYIMMEKVRLYFSFTIIVNEI